MICADRLARSSGGDRGVKGRKAALIDRVVEMQGQPVGRHAQGMGQQRAGIARRPRHACGVKPRNGAAQRLGAAHASISASLPAWSWAVSASITSVRSPAMICGSA
jgi:hypothetical protein